MHLEFDGAADEVTGSLHRLHVGAVDVALDCGLFQGIAPRRTETTASCRGGLSLLARWY